MDQRIKITPPALAKRYGVGIAKIHSWIQSGELRAMNAGSGGRRPRYLIDLQDLADFEKRRQVVPAPAPAPRPRKSECPQYV